jgi:hypothetical protein
MTPFKTLTLISGCVALAACGADPVADNASAPVNETAGTEAANAAQANLSGGETISSGEGDTEFRVSWPAAAAAIPQLSAKLRTEAEQLRKENEAGLRAEQASAKENGYPFRGYMLTKDWAVAADVPALLILSSDGYTYTGGAHGMPLVDVLFWDKAGNKALETKDLFDEAALGRAVKDRFCKALDEQRAEKRGAPVGSAEPSPISEFDSCVDPLKQNIIPVAARSGALDTIHFVIMPYEAGPYAEGIYEVAVPVDAAVLGAVKPAWKSAFTAN